MSEADEMSILVVDDDPSIIMLLRIVLEEHGYVVDTAQTAEQARDLFACTHSGLVLLDLSLHGAGQALGQSFVAQGADLVIMSARANVATAARALGACAAIEKPFELRMLLETLEKVARKEVAVQVSMQRDLQGRA